MRVRTATTALGITAALLTVPACTTTSTPGTAPSSHAEEPSGDRLKAALLSSAALETRLLDVGDLGSGYLREQKRPVPADDVTVIGCPALSKLGGDTATGGTLAFPRKAKVAFAYGNSSSEITEELYSDSADTLSAGIGRIFDAMTGCSPYQVVAGGTPIDVESQRLAAPRSLGDEGWSQLLTFSTAGRSTVVQETVIRTGSLLVVLPGARRPVPRQGPLQGRRNGLTCPASLLLPADRREQQRVAVRPYGQYQEHPRRRAAHTPMVHHTKRLWPATPSEEG